MDSIETLAFVLKLVLGCMILFPTVGVLGIILIDHYFDKKIRTQKALDEIKIRTQKALNDMRYILREEKKTE